MQFPTIDNSTASESNPSTELSDIETNPKFSHWKNLQKGLRRVEKCTQSYILSVIGDNLRKTLIQATAGITKSKPKFNLNTIDQLSLEVMQSLVPKRLVEEYDVTALTTVLRNCNWLENIQFNKVVEVHRPYIKIHKSKQNSIKRCYNDIRRLSTEGKSINQQSTSSAPIHQVRRRPLPIRRRVRRRRNLTIQTKVKTTKETVIQANQSVLNIDDSDNRANGGSKLVENYKTVRETRTENWVSSQDITSETRTDVVQPNPIRPYLLRYLDATDDQPISSTMDWPSGDTNG